MSKLFGIKESEVQAIAQKQKDQLKVKEENALFGEKPLAVEEFSAVDPAASKIKEEPEFPKPIAADNEVMEI